MTAPPTNVFGALNQMYIMGDRAPLPIVYAGISQTCLQALYVASFFVYAIDNAADWLLTYSVGTGISGVTFPLRDWLVMLMIGSCTIGSVCTFLLLYLCLETAFRRRSMQVEPYRGGCALIWQKFWCWLTDVNIFRLSFLILVFEDLVMTIVNFWFLSSCNVPLQKWPSESWPQILSCITTVIALVWRVSVTYWAYRHIWSMIESNPTNLPGEFDEMKESCSSLEDNRSVLGITSRRPDLYDECWPVRYSAAQSFPKKKQSHTTCNNYANSTGSDTLADLSDDEALNTPTDQLHRVVHGCCCCTLCCVLYLLLVGSCCVPCIYHYTCRKHAHHHRQRFARSCIRICATCFYLTMLLLSVLAIITLLVCNSIWLSNVYGRGGMGSVESVPAIRYACAYIDENTYQAYMSFESKFSFISERNDLKGYCFEIAKTFRDTSVLHVRKPLQSGAFYLYVAKTVQHIEPLLLYDFGFEHSGKCLKNFNLTLTQQHHYDSFPYWTACSAHLPVYAPQAFRVCNQSAAS